MRRLGVSFYANRPIFETLANSHIEAGEHFKDYERTLQGWRAEGILGADWLLHEVGEVFNPLPDWMLNEPEWLDDEDEDEDGEAIDG